VPKAFSQVAISIIGYLWFDIIGWILFFVVIGDNFDTVKILNRIVGSTDPNLAKEGTLRKLGQDVRRNIAHSSSEVEEALKSIVHFFPNEEIVSDILRSLNR
jgi:nucleoside diphosphate kinase